MLDARALIDEHRSKGVLVDTNLLVLLLVGWVNRLRIPGFKRTQNFTVEDFDTLSELVTWFGRPVTTPHVLSQVSDLTDLSGDEFEVARKRFGQLIGEMTEHCEAGVKLIADPLFVRLGLTDVAIANICERGVLVLTSDVILHLALQDRGIDALNFNHVRPMGWEPRR